MSGLTHSYVRRKQFEAKILVATLGQALNGKGKRKAQAEKVSADEMLGLLGGLNTKNSRLL